jgi:hypothetical protein
VFGRFPTLNKCRGQLPYQLLVTTEPLEKCIRPHIYIYIYNYIFSVDPLMGPGTGPAAEIRQMDSIGYRTGIVLGIVLGQGEYQAAGNSN